MNNKVIMTRKFSDLLPMRFLDKQRYGGLGRPKNTDYSYETLESVQDKMNKIYNKKLSFMQEDE